MLQRLSLLFILGLHSAAMATNNEPSSARAIRFSKLPEQVCAVTEKGAGIQNKALVRFGLANEKDSFCTATVIGPRLFLTAAHCIEPDSTEEHSIVCAGDVRRTFDIKNQAHIFPTRKFKDDVGADDMALVEVNEDIGIPPFRILKSQAELEELTSNPQNCIQTGFGFFTEGTDNEYTGIQHGTTLDESPLKLVSDVSSHQLWYQIEDLTLTAENQIQKSLGLSCADNQCFNQVFRKLTKQIFAPSQKLIADLPVNNKESMILVPNGRVAPGDSGGPLLCRNLSDETVIVGVLSGSNAKLVDYYTNTWFAHAWIQSFKPSQKISKTARTKTLQAEIQQLQEQLQACEKQSRPSQHTSSLATDPLGKKALLQWEVEDCFTQLGERYH